MSSTNKETISQIFNRVAKKLSEFFGNVWTFLVCFIVVIAWITLGFMHGFTNMWYIIGHTIATIITFLMIFILQNSQNRDTQMIQLKLNEIIRSHHIAHNSMIDLSKLSDEELKTLEQAYLKLSKKSPEGCPPPPEITR